jgi:hypothetical protein
MTQCKEYQDLAYRVLMATATLQKATELYHNQTNIHEEATALAAARDAERSAKLDLREHIKRHGCGPATQD